MIRTLLTRAIILPYSRVHSVLHPDGKTHGGIALMIRNSIRYYEIGKYQRDYLQIRSVVEVWNGCITISAVYLLSKYVIKSEQYITFFEILDNRFIAVEDYNAKYT